MALVSASVTTPGFPNWHGQQESRRCRSPRRQQAQRACQTPAVCGSEWILNAASTSGQAWKSAASVIDFGLSGSQSVADQGMPRSVSASGMAAKLGRVGCRGFPRRGRGGSAATGRSGRGSPSRPRGHRLTRLCRGRGRITSVAQRGGKDSGYRCRTHGGCSTTARRSGVAIAATRCGSRR
jgi:hypothetical protein